MSKDSDASVASPSSSSSSSSEDEIIEPAEYLATSRSRRSNAGARMSSLLDREEQDEFYQTHYGGFHEEENDSDFDSTDSSDSENVIDSDFDIDENVDVHGEDGEEENEEAIEKRLAAEERETARRAKSGGIYKDPKSKKPATTLKKQTGSTGSDETLVARVENVTLVGRARAQQQTTSQSQPPPSSSKVATAVRTLAGSKRLLVSSSNIDENVSKNLRLSTKQVTRDREARDEAKRKEAIKRQRKAARLARKRKQTRGANVDSPDRPLTQEELLEEAKRTEVENLKSLEAFKNLEIERAKKNKSIKPSSLVPMIRFHSYTEIIPIEDEDSNGTLVDGDETVKQPKVRKVSHNIICFPDDRSFEQSFGVASLQFDRERSNPTLATNLMGKIVPPPPVGVDTAMANIALATNLLGEPTLQITAQTTISSSTTTTASTAKTTTSTTSASSSSKALQLSKRPFENFNPVRGNGRRLCPLTLLPAKYVDPLTQVPYATRIAFQNIRAVYYQFLEEHPALRNDPLVKEFVKRGRLSTHVVIDRNNQSNKSGLRECSTFLRTTLTPAEMKGLQVLQQRQQAIKWAREQNAKKQQQQKHEQQKQQQQKQKQQSMLQQQRVVATQLPTVVAVVEQPKQQQQQQLPQLNQQLQQQQVQQSQPNKKTKAKVTITKQQQQQPQQPQQQPQVQVQQQPQQQQQPAKLQIVGQPPQLPIQLVQALPGAQIKILPKVTGNKQSQSQQPQQQQQQQQPTTQIVQASQIMSAQQLAGLQQQFPGQLHIKFITKGSATGAQLAQVAAARQQQQQQQSQQQTIQIQSQQQSQQQQSQQPQLVALSSAAVSGGTGTGSITTKPTVVQYFNIKGKPIAVARAAPVSTNTINTGGGSGGGGGGNSSQTGTSGNMPPAFVLPFMAGPLASNNNNNNNSVGTPSSTTTSSIVTGTGVVNTPNVVQIQPQQQSSQTQSQPSGQPLRQFTINADNYSQIMAVFGGAANANASAGTAAGTVGTTGTAVVCTASATPTVSGATIVGGGGGGGAGKPTIISVKNALGPAQLQQFLAQQQQQSQQGASGSGGGGVASISTQPKITIRTHAPGSVQVVRGHSTAGAAGGVSGQQFKMVQRSITLTPNSTIVGNVTGSGGNVSVAGGQQKVVTLLTGGSAAAAAAAAASGGKLRTISRATVAQQLQQVSGNSANSGTITAHSVSSSSSTSTSGTSSSSGPTSSGTPIVLATSGIDPTTGQPISLEALFQNVATNSRNANSSSSTSATSSSSNSSGGQNSTATPTRYVLTSGSGRLIHLPVAAVSSGGATVTYRPNTTTIATTNGTISIRTAGNIASLGSLVVTPGTPLQVVTPASTQPQQSGSNNNNNNSIGDNSNLNTTGGTSSGSSGSGSGSGAISISNVSQQQISQPKQN